MSETMTDTMIRGIDNKVLKELDGIAERNKRSRNAEILVAIEAYVAVNKSK